MAFARPALGLRSLAARALASAAAGPSRAAVGDRRAASFYSPQLAGLTEDQAELRQAFADFAAAEVEPIAEKVDRENAFPQELWTKLGDQGLLGLTVSEEYGGLGKSYFDHLLVMEGASMRRTRRADDCRAQSGVWIDRAQLRSSLQRTRLWCQAFLTRQLCVNQLSRWGTKAQKEKYLPDLISGRKAGSLAMSEPGSGSDVVSMRTRADKKGDRYVLNGSKMVRRRFDCRLHLAGRLRSGATARSTAIGLTRLSGSPTEITPAR